MEAIVAEVVIVVVARVGITNHTIVTVGAVLIDYVAADLGVGWRVRPDGRDRVVAIRACSVGGLEVTAGRGRVRNLEGVITEVVVIIVAGRRAARGAIVTIGAIVFGAVSTDLKDAWVYGCNGVVAVGTRGVRGLCGAARDG